MELAVIIICLCTSQVYGDEETKKVVQVEQGMLEGVVSVTDTGVKIATFPSVPYAKPPVGKLRFKAPEPPEKWEGVRPADSTFEVCPQMEGGSEDCLYLNIVEPQDMGNNLSVMIWIHGGAFFIGSASLEFYKLDDFVKRGVVMVSINYRLSALGFLSVNGTDVSPNAGLKDQIAALRWVQRNIASFSGNPNDVTIFGESAGGASVQYLITSPMAKGLFSKAIMMSGSACTNWAFRESNTEDAFLLGESLGKKTSDPQELVDFLRTVPAEDILDKVLDQWYTRKKEKRLKSINAQTISFLPTLEYPVRAGDSFEEVFLPDRPATLLEQGNFQKVPQIIGMNSLEASTLTEVPHTDEWPQVESNWESMVPEDMRLQKGSPASKHVAARIKEFYFKNQALDDHAGQQYLECSSDADWTRRTTECAKYTAKHIPGQLWAYYFTYFTPNSFTCNIQNCELISGAAHFDDVPLMYKEHPLASEYTPDDVIINSRFLKMWTNFARTGRPDTGEDVSWTPVEDGVLSHLVIDKVLRMDPHDLRENYTKFWTDVGMEVANMT